MLYFVQRITTVASSTQSNEVWTGLLEGHPGVVITHSSVSLLQEQFRGPREIRDHRKVALGQECNQGAPSLQTGSLGFTVWSVHLSSAHHISLADSGSAGGRHGEGLLKSSSQPWEGRARTFSDVHDLHVADIDAVWTSTVPHRALVFKRFLALKFSPI